MPHSKKAVLVFLLTGAPAAIAALFFLLAAVASSFSCFDSCSSRSHLFYLFLPLALVNVAVPFVTVSLMQSGRSAARIALVAAVTIADLAVIAWIAMQGSAASA